MRSWRIAGAHDEAHLGQAADCAAAPAPQWYAAYTSARHEKRVAAHLQHITVECFLPLYEEVHRWKDRHARVQLPLFPGYVFVHIAVQDRFRVLQSPSILGLVSFQGHPAPLADSEIEPLRAGIYQRLRFEPHPYLRKGCRVRIRNGPLAGSEGILVRVKENLRVVLSVELIMRSVAVEVDANDVERLR